MPSRLQQAQTNYFAEDAPAVRSEATQEKSGSACVGLAAQARLESTDPRLSVQIRGKK
jgi:hypothetical protein